MLSSSRMIGNPVVVFHAFAEALGELHKKNPRTRGILAGVTRAAASPPAQKMRGSAFAFIGSSYCKAQFSYYRMRLNGLTPINDAARTPSKRYEIRLANRKLCWVTEPKDGLHFLAARS